MLWKETVLDGEERGPNPCGDTELVVDVLHVVTDGLRGDEEDLGHPPIRHAPDHEAQDLHLAFAEAGKPV